MLPRFLITDAVHQREEGFSLKLTVRAFGVKLQVEKLKKGGIRCHVIEVLFAANADVKI